MVSRQGPLTDNWTVLEDGPATAGDHVPRPSWSELGLSAVTNRTVGDTFEPLRVRASAEAATRGNRCGIGSRTLRTLTRDKWAPIVYAPA
jgi:hypothetical protein